MFVNRIGVENIVFHPNPRNRLVDLCDLSTLSHSAINIRNQPRRSGPPAIDRPRSSDTALRTHRMRSWLQLMAATRPYTRPACAPLRANHFAICFSTHLFLVYIFRLSLLALSPSAKCTQLSLFSNCISITFRSFLCHF